MLLEAWRSEIYGESKDFQKKKKNVTGNPPSAEFTSKIFKKKLKFTIFIHFKKERAKNCWPQLTTVDWASLPARGAHPRVASWMLSPTELRLLGWDTSSNPNLCFFVGMMLENNKGTKGIKGFWVFGNVWCICSLMEPLVTSDLIHQPEPQWCDHYTGLYKSPAVRPHRQERWSFMIVRWWKSCHEDEQHFTSKWLLAQNVPYARLWRSMLMTSHQWYPLTPSTTAAHQTKLFNIWHQHSFLEQHRGHETTCPNDSLHTNARMLGIFDNANGNLEIGWLTRGSSMRVCPITILQKTVCKQQSEITSICKYLQNSTKPKKAGPSHHRITQQRFPRMDVKGPFLWNGMKDISTTHDASNSWVSGLGPGPVSIQESQRIASSTAFIKVLLVRNWKKKQGNGSKISKMHIYFFQKSICHTFYLFIWNILKYNKMNQLWKRCCCIPLACNSRHPDTPDPTSRLGEAPPGRRRPVLGVGFATAFLSDSTFFWLQS